MRITNPLFWLIALLIPQLCGFLGGLLDPIGLFSGGGGGGGIANDTNTTNAAQDDHSTLLGNNAVLNNGTMTITDADATKAALESNTTVFGLALEALKDIAGSSFAGQSAGVVNGASVGGGGFTATGATAESATSKISTPAVIAIGGGLLLLGGILLLKRK